MCLNNINACKTFACLFVISILMLNTGCASTFEGIQSDVKSMFGDDETAEDKANGGMKETSASNKSSEKQLITQIQNKLSELGYKPGPANGRLGSRTEAAIQDFQLDNDLRIDGKPSEDLLTQLNERAAAI